MRFPRLTYPLLKQPQRWFAWYPVWVDADEQWCWLEHVWFFYEEGVDDIVYMTTP